MLSESEEMALDVGETPSRDRHSNLGSIGYCCRARVLQLVRMEQTEVLEEWAISLDNSITESSLHKNRKGEALKIGNRYHVDNQLF